MELTLWTYEGPPHVGAIRIAASMRDVHLGITCASGDTYADLLFTMIEREGRRPPVTWTTFQARDLGSSTAEMVIETLQGVCERYQPQGIAGCRVLHRGAAPGSTRRIGARAPVYRRR
jgi:light-independent protochlorophyllide reductase subunit B